MDLSLEIRSLEKRGVFIHTSYEHYDNGSNCNFSLEFKKFRQENNQTGWYGDNHEFGDAADCLETAVRFANWLLEDDHLYWYFYNPTETITKEGHDNWMKYQSFKELSDLKIYKEFNNTFKHGTENN